MDKDGNFSTDLWFLIIIVLSCLGVFGPQCAPPALATPQEPPLSKLHKWYPVQDGTVILEYRIVDKYSVKLWRFKHAQKTVATKTSSCNEITIDGDEVRLLTQEAKPSSYIIERNSSGFSPEFNLDFTHKHW